MHSVDKSQSRQVATVKKLNMNEEGKVTMTIEKKQSKVRGWVFVCVALVGMVFLAAGSCGFLHHEQAADNPASKEVTAANNEKQTREKRERTQARLKQLMEQSRLKAAQQDAQDAQATLAELEKHIDACFDRATGNVPKVVDHFRSVKVCTKLTWKMAKDKVCSDSHEVEDAIQPILDHEIIAPCTDGQAGAEYRLRRYLRDLRDNDSQYRLDVFQQTNQLLESEDIDMTLVENFTNELYKEDGFVSKVMEQSVTTTGLMVGSAIELICIRSTLATLRVLLGGIAGKVVTSASTSVIIASADGPLPILDIVGAGVMVASLAWTGYDIYQVTKVLPQEMRTSLNAAIERYRGEVKQKCREMIEQMKAERDRQRQQQEEEAMQQLAS